jgi:hypothetical protein
VRDTYFDTQLWVAPNTAYAASLIRQQGMSSNAFFDTFAALLRALAAGRKKAGSSPLHLK